MSEHTFRNHGQLFADDQFGKIIEAPEWASDKIETARIRMEELVEKWDQLEEDANKTGELETQFYWVSTVLRILGYTFSVAEMTSDSEVRPDFALFYSADDFRTALPHRTEREYFSNVVSVVRSFAWDANLDEFDAEMEGPSNPAFEIDRAIRATGVSWGIMTNGRKWRLYHRDTSGLFSTFFEVDLLAAIQAADLEQFKYFWCIFSPEGLGGTGSDDPLVLRLLH